MQPALDGLRLFSTYQLLAMIEQALGPNDF
jgi:hypothetical protein